jgi:hypothetical protein
LSAAPRKRRDPELRHPKGGTWVPSVESCSAEKPALFVTVGAEQRVTVRADDNLLRDVDTQVQDSTLEISQPDNLDLAPRSGST